MTDATKPTSKSEAKRVKALKDVPKPFDLEQMRSDAATIPEYMGGVLDCCDEIDRLRVVIAARSENWLNASEALQVAQSTNEDLRALHLERTKLTEEVCLKLEIAEASLARCVTEVGEWGAKCGELRIERDSWRHAFDVLYGTLRRFANEGSSVNYQARKALNHPSVQAVLDVPAVERGGAFMSAENRALDAEARVKALTEALEWYAAGTFRKDNGSRARAALAADKEGT